MFAVSKLIGVSLDTSFISLCSILPSLVISVFIFLILISASSLAIFLAGLGSRLVFILVVELAFHITHSMVSSLLEESTINLGSLEINLVAIVAFNSRLFISEQNEAERSLFFFRGYDSVSSLYFSKL